MAVIVNRNTQQTPITAGLTGTQAVKFIHADRVYIKTADVSSTPITVKSNGSTPAGYTDLGIISTPVAVTYTKDVKEVRTGIDEVLRATYDGKKTGKFEFQLSQFDDAVMSAVTGLTASQIINGSVYQYAVGSESVIQKAIILVMQNKLDGKEWQFYNPNAFISFNITENSGETVLSVTGDLPLFTHGSGEVLFLQSIFT